ncbi:STAS domain-containing protein [Planomicrobium sp. CPCC 101079]|uniref:STAS domain-containing protein n=1 Tax=Planomicrobium sp. CPCC 101079 TaxID=2599618 RepID=UPI0011B4038D|nr:STAS domain-containing protein [Planomicrobium sp. CPCC 101079]TWT09346.1 STAS domain-containing protein [Planomicrobium sp. CPCC 101079]
MASFKGFSAYISSHLESIAEEVVQAVQKSTNQRIPEDELEQASKMYQELMKAFAETVENGSSQAIPEVLIQWSKKNARMQAAAGGSLSEIVVRYPPTRAIFTDIFTRISESLGLSLNELSFLINRINAMLDVSLNETFFAFERLSEQFKEESQKELMKLSAPIVPVMEDVVVIPLIGFIDDNRTRHIMENVIPKLAETKVNHVISDLSGVVIIDNNIARSLHQIGAMLRLMGIHVVSAGMRPELVQTVVNSGIDMSKIESFATVKQALQSIKQSAYSASNESSSDKIR